MSIGLVILVVALGGGALTVLAVLLIMRAALRAARRLPPGEPGRSDGAGAHDDHHLHSRADTGWMD